MVFTSGQINQAFTAQQAMFGGQMAYAQQLSYPMHAALQPGMPPPPPPSAAAGFMSAQPQQSGMVGEQFAAQGMSSAAMLGGMAFSGAQIYGMLGGGGMMGAAGRALDPFTYLSGGWGAGSGLGARMGMGMMGRGAMGLAGAGAAALPIYGAYKAAETYGSAFMGGMQDQTALNATLRGNFQHFGGGGAFNRGFSQQQMGQIGMDVASVVRQDPYLSMGEASGLIGQGAQNGMFTGVRDVSEFNQKFRQMLDTLKGVQRELGGSLEDAMTFVNEARASGVFQTADRLRLASGMRTTQAVTGMNAMQVGQMQQFGAQLSRSVGGRAAQGAFGAQRSLQQVGAMVQSGVLNDEQIFEMTGQTGAEGQMAFAQNMMQRVAQFSRRPAGRYSIFGLARDASGRDLDPAQLQRFMSGDMGVGELSRRAHGNVSRMGRARAINQEGHLRGALLEQGGIAGQVGIMRMMVGDRLLNQDDDLASLVLQRRFHMSRGESETMMSLMRNQGSIAREESLGRIGSARQMARQRQLEESNPSAIMDQLGNTLSNRLGITSTREMGQRTMTRISSMIERAMNDMLGVVDEQMTRGTQAATSNAAIGRASSAQMARISRLARAGQDMYSRGGGFQEDPFGRGAMQLPEFMGGERSRGAMIEAYGFNVSGYGGGEGGAGLRGFGEMGDTEADFLGMMGINARGLRATARAGRGRAMSVAERERAAMDISLARAGQVRGGAATALERISGMEGINRRVGAARLAAFGARGQAGLEDSNLFQYMGDEFQGSNERLALTALMSRQGINLDEEGLGDPTGMQRRGRSQFTAGGVARDVGGVLGNLAMGNLVGAGRQIGNLLTGRGAPGGLAGLDQPRDVIESRHRRAMSYISRGGGLGEAERAGSQRVSRENYEALMQSEDVGSVIQQITAASRSGDTAAVQRNIQSLRRMGMTRQGDDAMAIESMAQQMEQEADRYNGRIGGHWEAGLDTSEDVRAFVNETQATGRSMSRIAAGMDARGRVGGVSGRAAQRSFERIGEALQTPGSMEAGYQAQQQLFEQVAMGSEEGAEELMARLGSARIEGNDPEAVRARAQRDAMVGEMSRRRALQRDLTGGGRRGQQQARETQFSLITGGTLGGMEFEMGGRRVRGRNAERVLEQALSGQGNMSEEDRAGLRRQLVQQMQQRGISGAEELVGALQEGLTESGSGERVGRLSAEEAQRLRATAREHGGDIQAAQREALRQAQERQNPLDAQRNQTLTDILRAIQQQNNNPEGGGEPTTEGGGRGEGG